MAEQTPGIGGGEIAEQIYNPSITDWRALIVLQPDYGQALTSEHGSALRASLKRLAFNVMGATVARHDESDALLISFYLGDMDPNAAVQEGIASVYKALHAAGMGDMQFLAMQLSRQLEVEVFGEEYFASDRCFVGEPAYELYREYVSAYEALSSQD